MEISQPNNATGNVGIEPKFGIRVSAPPGDPFLHLVGPDWHTVRWFATREERDHALRDMTKRHSYSRLGDVPSIVVEAIDRQ